jgi:SAM-dependent methyltransferase
MKSPWNRWYKRKGYAVEPEIPKLDRLFKKGYIPKILDLGCGHGRHVLYFARKGYEVYGMDRYSAVLERLRKDLKSRGLSAELRTGDFIKGIPYDTGFFDAVIATRSVDHANTRDEKRIFREITRVLKNGGILFLQVPSYESTKKYEESIGEKWRSEFRWAARRIYVPVAGPEKGVLHYAFDRKMIVKLLRDYRIVRMHSNSRHHHGYCVIARRRRRARPTGAVSAAASAPSRLPYRRAARSARCRRARCTRSRA